MNVKKLAPYAKSIVAGLGVLALAAQATADGRIDGDEVMAVLTAAAVAFGVYQVPNKK